MTGQLTIDQATYDRLLRYARTLVPADDSEDLVQMTLLQAYEAFDNYDDSKSALMTWLAHTMRTQVTFVTDRLDGSGFPWLCPQCWGWPLLASLGLPYKPGSGKSVLHLPHCASKGPPCQSGTETIHWGPGKRSYHSATEVPHRCGLCLSA